MSKQKQDNNLDKERQSIYRLTFCGKAMEAAMEECSKDDTFGSLFSESLKEDFRTLFDQAIMDSFKSINSQLTIKGKGSYRSLHGNYWEFKCTEADLKSESLEIPNKSIEIYSLQSMNAKDKKSKKSKK